MTKEELIAAVTKKHKPHTVEGVEFLLLPLSYEDFEAIQAERKEAAAKGDENAGIKAAFQAIAWCVCDEAGTRLFQPDDCRKLPPSVSEELAKEILRRNGLGGSSGNSQTPTT